MKLPVWSLPEWSLLLVQYSDWITRIGNSSDALQRLIENDTCSGPFREMVLAQRNVEFCTFKENPGDNYHGNVKYRESITW